jgi:hypothetical protein
MCHILQASSMMFLPLSQVHQYRHLFTTLHQVIDIPKPKKFLNKNKVYYQHLLRFLCFTPANLSPGCNFVVAEITSLKIQIQNSGSITDYESIIYNFKVQMPFLNQVTTECCIWQNYDY